MDAAVTMDEQEKSFTTGAHTGKLGMWVFLASDALTFGALLAAYGALRMSSKDWPHPASVLDVPLTALNTFILICSSVSMVKALSGARHDNQKKLWRNLALTILGGLIFLGIQAYEWTHLIRHQGLTASAHLFNATFFSLTGFHGFHVFCGVVYLSCILSAALKGRYGSQNYFNVEIAGLYWHFVDLVWILVFTFVYLL